MKISEQWLRAMAAKEGNGIVSMGGLVEKIKQAQRELAEGNIVTYRLNVAGAGNRPRYERRGPVKVTEIMRAEIGRATGSVSDTGGSNKLGKVIKAKLSDGPCWVPVEFIDRIEDDVTRTGA